MKAGLYMISGTPVVTGNFLKDLWTNNKPVAIIGGGLLAYGIYTLATAKPKHKKASVSGYKNKKTKRK
jgi:hypothetical protein